MRPVYSCLMKETQFLGTILLESPLMFEILEKIRDKYSIDKLDLAKDPHRQPFDKRWSTTRLSTGKPFAKTWKRRSEPSPTCFPRTLPPFRGSLNLRRISPRANIYLIHNRQAADNVTKGETGAI